MVLILNQPRFATWLILILCYGTIFYEKESQNTYTLDNDICNSG